MDSASSLAYPGSRILAGWWRQLHAHRPSALWVGHLFVHRVEALVESADVQPLDPLALHVLHAVAVDAPESLPQLQVSERLPGRLHLPASAVHQILLQLQGRRLVERCERGCWCLSERGQAVLAGGSDRAARRERRAFAFVEELTPAGRRHAAPRFAPLGECPAVPWAVNDAHHFDVGLLTQCLAADRTWKERSGFPFGPTRLVLPGDEATADRADEAWQQIIIDRPERVAICFVSGPDQSLRGFAAHAENWRLEDKAPVLQLPAGSSDVVGELSVPPSAWEEAWRLWCRQRNLPLSEAEACQLRFDGIHLHISAPETFAQRLRQAKNDPLRDEAGLLAGDGYLRAAAILRLET
jgi:hypothetical protein